MSASRQIRTTVLVLLGYGASFAFLLPVHGAESSNTITAVSSRTSIDYNRTKLSDGSFPSETYAFGEGGYYRAPVYDSTIDNVTFLGIARMLATPLALQGYVPTKDPGKASLLIMVYWGMTSGAIGPDSARFVQNRNDRVIQPAHGTEPVQIVRPEPYGPVSIEGAFIDARNAVILGYDTDLARTSGHEMTALEIERSDLIAEVQHHRYFVVLMAYDFQRLWKQGKHKLLWETRFSVRQQNNDFGKMVPEMAKYASQYFGQNTQGLIRRPLPEGKVEVGAPKMVSADRESNDSSFEAALIAGPNVSFGVSVDSKRDLAAVPPVLAEQMEAYQQEKASLQNTLAGVIKSQAPGTESRLAIDTFNAEYAARIAALNRSAENIRSELAKIATTESQHAGGQSIDALVQQFNDSIKEVEWRESLFTHP